jgi:hypothetical protein
VSRTALGVSVAVAAETGRRRWVLRRQARGEAQAHG